MTREHRDRMDLYLDDQLSDEERAAFELALESDASLREEVELQRSIDRQLRSAFTPSEAVVPEVPAPRNIGLRARTLVYGLAAAVVLVVTVGIVLWPRLAPLLQGSVETGPRSVFVSPETEFARLEADDFAIDWRCETDEQFRRVTSDALGVPLLVSETPGLEVVGWRYIDGYDFVMSSETLTLISEYEGEPVIVLLDTAERLNRDIGRKTIEGSGGINVFRRDLDGVVMLELSRREAPVVVGAFVAGE